MSARRGKNGFIAGELFHRGPGDETFRLKTPTIAKPWISGRELAQKAR